MARMAGKNPAIIPTKTANPKASNDSHGGMEEILVVAVPIPMPISMPTSIAVEEEPSWCDYFFIKPA